MKKIGFFLLLSCFVLPATAQKKAPKWMAKEKKAVVSVTTYRQDGSKMATGTGFFISESGEALSGYTLFKGAYRATVTDVDGQEWPVTHIMSADELYDVVRFRVEGPKKVSYLPLAQEPLTVGTEVFLLPYTVGKIIPYQQGTVQNVNKVKDNYGYYQVSFPLEKTQLNAPLLTAEGEVFGVAQADASGKNVFSYGISAGYIRDMELTSTDVFNSVYTQIGIRKAWPKDFDQALAVLYIVASGQDAQAYLQTLDDFIRAFPESPEGYIDRAACYAYRRAELAGTPAEQQAYLGRAFDELDKAARYLPKKSDVWYNRAKLIYGVAVADSSLVLPEWSQGAALEAVEKAIGEEDIPLYRQLQGDICFSLQQYEAALEAYNRINAGDMASASSYYRAAKAKMLIPGAQLSDAIVLLDSAVAKCGTPVSKEAAPYILERIELKTQLENYREVVADYDLYYRAMGADVPDAFYFYRQQAKFRLGDLDGALADIQDAIVLNKNEPRYYAEEAAVYVRMKKYEEALKSVEKALALTPDFAACYRLRGVCYVRQGKKAEGCEAFRKAKEYGDPLADKLLQQYGGAE